MAGPRAQQEAERGLRLRPPPGASPPWPCLSTAESRGRSPGLGLPGPPTPVQGPLDSSPPPRLPHPGEPPGGWGEWVPSCASRGLPCPRPPGREGPRSTHPWQSPAGSLQSGRRTGPPPSGARTSRTAAPGLSCYLYPGSLMSPTSAGTYRGLPGCRARALPPGVHASKREAERGSTRPGYSSGRQGARPATQGASQGLTPELLGEPESSLEGSRLALLSAGLSLPRVAHLGPATCPRPPLCFPGCWR